MAHAHHHYGAEKVVKAEVAHANADMNVTPLIDVVRWLYGRLGGSVTLGVGAPAVMQFIQVSLPPRDTGTMCSRVSSSKGKWPPQ